MGRLSGFSDRRGACGVGIFPDIWSLTNHHTAIREPRNWNRETGAPGLMDRLFLFRRYVTRQQKNRKIFFS
jgi:hypothetical protein